MTSQLYDQAALSLAAYAALRSGGTIKNIRGQTTLSCEVSRQTPPATNGQAHYREGGRAGERESGRATRSGRAKEPGEREGDRTRESGRSGDRKDR